MKKFFAWALVLAMMLTMLPMMDAHNHAHAAETPATYTPAPYVPAYDCTKLWGKTEHNFNGSATGRCLNSDGSNYCRVYNPDKDYGECGFCDACPHNWSGAGGKCSNCGHAKANHKHDAYYDYYYVYCTKTGTARVLCNNCSVKYTYTTAIDPDAHNIENNKCTNVDKEYNVCTYHVCTWSATGNGKCQTVRNCTATHVHTDDDFKTVDPSSYVAGNCMTPSSYNALCDVCGAAKPMTGETDDDNHSWKIDGTCANGCDAKCEHVTFVDNKCAVCGCPDHVHPNEAFTDTLKTPGNCVKGAVYTRTYACGATEAVTGDVDPDAHTWAPNGQCANTGCNQACTHNWVDGVCTECTFACKHTETTQTTTVPGNCKNVGSADLICKECKKNTGTVELPIDPDNHKWVVFPFGAGYCVRCNEINVEYDDFEDVLPEEKPVENPCKEHQWASLAFGAWYCTKCGATATDINPLEPEICDHADTYINVIKAATCKKEGSAEKICDICETVLDANVVLPIDKENGHDLVIFPFGASWCNLCHEINVDREDFIEPENPQDSCDHEWVSFPFGVWLCPKCMLQTEEDPTVPVEPEEPKYCEKNEHQWASLAFGAWYCTKCGAKATDINPLEPEICNHADTYIDVTTPATCVATGIGNKMCDICETVLAVGLEVEIDPDAHQWGADANGNACCLLCGLYESELPKEEPCEHEWAAVATGWYCWKCNSVTLDNPFATEPVVLLGDVNDDGCVDGRDEVRLMKYLVGQGVHINKLNADLNGDGVIDGRDEIRLLYRLL